MAREALVVGAGIGGLAAALALRRAGWTVRVFERASNPGELGFALVLAPNALAALAELGIAEASITARFPYTAGEIRRADGTLLRRLSHAGPRLVVALRPAIHGALLEAIGRDTLELGAEAVHFEIDDRSHRVLLHLKNGGAAVGDLLVGADGVASIVRRQLHPDEPAASPSGYCALRGLAAQAAPHLEPVSAVMYLGDGLEAAAARASETDVYWYVSLLTSDVPPDDRTPSTLRDAIAARVDPRLAAIMRQTPSPDLRFDELFARNPLPVWGRDRVTLLGDAAHPVLPHTGQGAAQALEDAVALGITLGPTAALARHRDLPRALRRYEAVRASRTSAIVRLGRRIARTTTTHNPLTRWVRDTAIRVVPQALLERQLQIADPGDPHEALRRH